MTPRERFVDEFEKLKIYPAETVVVENKEAKEKGCGREAASLRLISHQRYITVEDPPPFYKCAHLNYAGDIQLSTAIRSTRIYPSTIIRTIFQSQISHRLPRMSSPSYEYAAGTKAPPTLTPSADDTYDWAAIQKSRPTAKLIKATAGAALPSFTQKITYDDQINDPPTSANSTFKVEASPKWFSIVSSEIDEKGTMNVTLGVQGGRR
ncbi:hypothetical protein P171DRAFT_430579 [Karstenula rhodostoma CBS 690.94]|uniref:Uncharacterized protein n=1 Tax=Karstenula rhodostoma CBS 690.94 TaxID=1392251 RepID=A0A9P4UDR2_9PLEO|nr:hypothetical protein P171DRAFT_430579 [Karstenula rhodostoma CBS 690.94]